MSILSISAIQNTQIIMLRVNSVGTTSAEHEHAVQRLRRILASKSRREKRKRVFSCYKLMSGLCEYYKSVNMFFSLFANVIYLP